MDFRKNPQLISDIRTTRTYSMGQAYMLPQKRGLRFLRWCPKNFGLKPLPFLMAHVQTHVTRTLGGSMGPKEVRHSITSTMTHKTD